MEAGQRIVGMQSHQRSEGRHRAGVAGVKLCEGVGILPGGRAVERIRGQRLVGA
jgi:hypothetical protein